MFVLVVNRQQGLVGRMGTPTSFGGSRSQAFSGEKGEKAWDLDCLGGSETSFLQTDQSRNVSYAAVRGKRSAINKPTRSLGKYFLPNSFWRVANAETLFTHRFFT